MNIATNYSATSNSAISSANSQTSNKAVFTIPTESVGELKVSGYLTYLGGSDYDPFKEIKTGSINFPDWLQTKAQAVRSDEEILKDLEELAKEHARMGTFNPGTANGEDRYTKLLDEFVSPVSPDRESILKNAVEEINGRLNSQNGYNIYGKTNLQEDYTMSGIYLQVLSQIEDNKNEDKDDEKEPIDYFIEALKGKEQDNINSGVLKKIVSSSGNLHEVVVENGKNTTTLVYNNYGELQYVAGISGETYHVGSITNGKANNAEFFDSNGQKIMSYDSASFGLVQCYTKEESEREREFFAAYTAAYNAALIV